MSKKKVLVIDDEDFIRELVKDFLELDEVQCIGAETSDEALEQISEETFDLILLDWHLGEMKAEDLIIRIKEIQEDVPILILTGDQHCDVEYLKEVGAEGIIFKPFQVNDFMESVKKFLDLEIIV
ncbi:MAG: response regulator [Candidatus Aminicenantes bacterium]|nr:response regulator [Candidatus Aminicenantes bacterium]NIM79809.1 response regulator [Candidatus Aminicenantes bacterium]NIN19139.1 response regulator [Candidatus Aminicenantes bacterium]NIN43043.1 response regulator [Candidatus Aminicenantes bacterium]NIN85784.1 response regulator [Candidatus Aminicenantes bacterium]